MDSHTTSSSTPNQSSSSAGPLQRVVSNPHPSARSSSPLRSFDFSWRTTVRRRGADTPPHGEPLTWWNGERELALRGWEAATPEHAEGWERTRKSVAAAVASALDMTKDVTHEALLIGVDVLHFAPVIGLEEAARALLGIWDSLQLVEINRLACLRITERCATILLSVRQEVAEAGNEVDQELRLPIDRLVQSFAQVHRFLQKQNHRPFIKRYLKREEAQRALTICDNALTDALGMFSMSIQIRILKQVLKAEQQRHADTEAILERMSPLNTPVNITRALPLVDDIPAAEPASEPALEHIRRQLRAVIAQQNEQDTARDAADMRRLIREALQANSDAEMIRVLQVGRDEMPEAIKTLQRALEEANEREGGEVEELEVVIEDVALEGAGLVRSATIESRKSSASGSTRRSPRDTLDREFMESGIEALRRMSGVETTLPSWTITRYEVDREEKIGLGFFSDVYKGTWRGRTVAIKVLAETTPRGLFKHEAEIWKTLQHPNVLELLGASSTSSDPPWFFVSPYYKNGSLVSYLKGLRSLDAVDPLKMVHEIVKGMAYLHSQDVLHGDLKGANVLVDDKGHCILSDFGQSEMKSEAYRITGTPLPHGTLRWQAPELMAGQSELTQAIDVYAFAMCCVELLTKGNLPWPLADDDAVRHFVLRENMRPELPLVRVWTPQLKEIVAQCWARSPAARPSFAQIDREVRALRTRFGSDLKESPRPPRRELPDPASRRTSPSMRPSKLPDVIQEDVVSEEFTSSSYETAEGIPSSFTEVSISTTASIMPSRSESSASTSSSYRSSMSDSAHSDSGEAVYDRSDSPSPDDEFLAARRNEKRYRMLLQHDFHPSLTLPLWTPTPVQLGAVGYHSRHNGEFITLFNSFRPAESAGALAQGIPSLYGYGQVKQGCQSVDKRSFAQRTMDSLTTWVGGRSPPAKGMAPTTPTGSPRNVMRRYSTPLRAGHKAAHLFAESTTYRYVEDLSTPKKWFVANVDHILALYGQAHQIQKEDLFLVIGTLEAQHYALYVSHAHPDSQLHFDVLAPRPATPWGRFSTSPSLVVSGGAGAGGPVYTEDGGKTHESTGGDSAQKVAEVGGRWDAVLIGKLRFRPDEAWPTSL